MKPLNTLTQVEIAALSDEQVEAYVDYKCAENGIPLTFGVIAQPESLKSNADITLIKFKEFIVDESTGKQIAQILADNNQYRETGGSKDRSYEIANDDWYISKPIIVRTKSPQLIAQEAVENAKLTREWKAYNEATDQQEGAIKERQKIVDEIYDVVYEARQFVRSKETLKAAFDKYMVMAQGNRDIAKTFFENAYSNSQYELIRDYILTGENV